MSTIGKRDKLIELQRNEAEVGDFSTQLEDWQTYHTTWASLRPMTGKEDEAEKAGISHAVEIDYPFQKVLSTDRVKYEDRIFNLVSVINIDESDQVLELLALEVIRDG